MTSGNSCCHLFIVVLFAAEVGVFSLRTEVAVWVVACDAMMVFAFNDCMLGFSVNSLIFLCKGVLL
jgi:hypothetical protein